MIPVCLGCSLTQWLSDCHMGPVFLLSTGCFRARPTYRHMAAASLGHPLTDGLQSTQLLYSCYPRDCVSFTTLQLFVTLESFFRNYSSKTIASSLLNVTLYLYFGISYMLTPFYQVLIEFLLFLEHYLGCCSRSIIISSFWLSCNTCN